MKFTSPGPAPKTYSVVVRLITEADGQRPCVVIEGAANHPSTEEVKEALRDAGWDITYRGCYYLEIVVSSENSTVKSLEAIAIELRWAYGLVVRRLYDGSDHN